MMVENIQKYFQHFGVNPEVQQVNLDPMPIAIQRLDIPVDRDNSYKTSADYLLNLHEQDFDDLHYVLGIVSSHCFFGKAVIRVGSKYYDPTDTHRSFTLPKAPFVSIYEMPVNDLKDFMVDNNNELPTVLNLKVVEMLSQK
ncbi:hypothetical protein [Endozoicomonas atrinae]|uniref:hypothetical protein n=1 Tax=Endozoicomonas atrinae TaxID=1333660 RepID=UPI000825325E|nr:hypothetical protein [Endozoicomonas atrinae]